MHVHDLLPRPPDPKRHFPPRQHRMPLFVNPELGAELVVAFPGGGVPRADFPHVGPRGETAGQGVPGEGVGAGEEGHGLGVHVVAVEFEGAGGGSGVGHPGEELACWLG